MDKKRLCKSQKPNVLNLQECSISLKRIFKWLYCRIIAVDLNYQD